MKIPLRLYILGGQYILTNLNVYSFRNTSENTIYTSASRPDLNHLIDIQGLRNALKKTRTHRRSQESLELQPLHTPTSNNNNKATLKRMSRVKSHDLSQEEGEKREQGGSEPVVSPIGAGLPLLHRLK